MPKDDIMRQIFAAADSVVFSENELRALAMFAVNEAVSQFEMRHYHTARAALRDAIGHLDALIEQKDAGK